MSRGVTCKLLWLWLKGPLNVRIGTQVKNSISESFISLSSFLPSEFGRKPRSLDEIDRWKATEFRQFLLYSGMVSLNKKIPKEIYDNFMLLMSAIHILANPHLAYVHCDYAKELLILFVSHFGKLYGTRFISYNVHATIHLPEDVRVHGHLDCFSSFPYLNFLGFLKKLVRKPSYVLPQVINRVREMTEFASYHQNKEGNIEN